MKRIIDCYLAEWKEAPYRKPLLLRGARQVGKTHAVRYLGEKFDNFVEINFESNEEAKTVFDRNLDPKRIILDLALITRKKITPGKTLLFFDEIQGTPKALTSLRYFYEELPEQHVIAAGSLLDFTIKSIGIPVGRVASLYMYPLSFIEFLCACGDTLLTQAMLNNPANTPISEAVHKKFLTMLGEYLAIGGMPEAVLRWQEKRDPLFCVEVHHALLDTYRQDFEKYAKNSQIKYLNVLLNAVPRQLGAKFKFSAIEGDYRKRELAPCLDLLFTSGVMNPVLRSAGNGVPIGAEVDPHDFKVVFLDIALSQASLGLDLKRWFLGPEQAFINKGALMEAFVGQELLVYAHPKQKSNLYYWRRNTPGSEAEVDYLMQAQASVIPIEVKSGSGSTLKSMHMFLESHEQSPYGLRFSTNNYSIHENIHSYPLYSIARALFENQVLDSKCWQALI